MGTDYGLYKWDGNSFTNIKNNNYSVSYSAIKEDKTGRIWCLNFSGQIFYVEGDSLKLFIDGKKMFETSLCYMIDYFPDIYIGFSKGIIKLDFYDKKISKFGITQPIYHLQSFNKNLLYYSILKIETSNLDAQSQILFQIEDGEKLSEIPNLFQLNNKIIVIGNLWVDRKRKCFFYEYSPDNDEKNISFNIENAVNVASVFCDSENKLIWLGATNELLVFNEKYQPVFNGKLLEGKNVSDIIKDKEGNYWVATLNQGVFIIPSIEILSFNQKLFDDNKIIAIKNVKQKLLFVETYGKIYQKNSFGNINLIGDINQKIEAVSYDPYFNSLNFGNIMSSFDIDSKTVQKSVYGRNIKSVSYICPYFILSSSSGDASIRTLFPAKINVNLKNILSKDVNFVKNYDKYYTSTLRIKRSHHNTYDFKNHNFYVSYSDGLFFYNNSKQEEVYFKNSPILITAMSKAINGVICCNTVDNNLLFISNGKVIKNIRVDIYIKEIVHWNFFLFLSSEHGLLKINTKNEEQIWITTHDGLPSNSILDIEIVNDTIFVATEKGVAKFACNKNFVNNTPPIVSFEKVAIWEKDTILHDSYFLPYNQNNITIYFKAISTRSRKNHHFKYRMLGLDTTWISQKSEINFVRFPSIPSGDYIFEVKAVNEDGYESKPVTIKIDIDAPIYQKWWFFVFCGIFVFILVSIIFRIRISIIKKRNSIINEKKDVENQLFLSQREALRSQMNPHFAFNALNSIQNYIISNDKELASDYLGLFADLMRKYLHYSQEEFISIDEEVETLNMYLELEKLRFEDTLNYKIYESENLSSLEIMIPVMLIQPFVENSIKHGLFHRKNNRILEISFIEKNNNILITVKDNGIGRKQSAEINKMRHRKHKSFATSALQKRINLINKSKKNNISIQYIDLYDDNKKSKGTLVEINIPLN